jgi:PAS domain-containing protein
MNKQELHNSSDRVTETILESISEGVFTVDDQWRITSFNRAAEIITGVLRKEAIGKHCFEVFRSNMCESDCALRRTMKLKKTFLIQLLLLSTRQDAGFRWSFAQRYLKTKKVVFWAVWKPFAI